MSENKEKVREKRVPTFLEAILPIIVMLVVLTIGKGIMGLATEPFLLMVTAFAGILAWRMGYSWDEMMQEICQKVARGMPAILILISVGAVVGTWMISGTIPMMIYYGVQIVNPRWMLVTSFIISAIVSVCTGTSWGTVATMGVALMGISGTLGVSLPATAGAVVAGAYFGDKLSPLSDTTNLSPIAAGSQLYEHIAHMLWTTIPASIISLIVYAIAGKGVAAGADASSETVTMMMGQLDQMFQWNILLFLPILVVLAGSILQKPTIHVMLLSSVVAGAEAMIFQGSSFADVITSSASGFSVSMVNRAGWDPQTATAEVLKLLERGGLSGMMSTCLLVFCAFCFAGIMSKSGSLDVIINKILSIAKNTGTLIAATVVSCITMAFSTGNSYLSILIPGEMFRKAYVKRGLHPKNLSRTLEDAGTVFVPLVPWSAAGAYMTSCLGVEVLDYLPWAVLCYVGFVIAIFYGFTGIGIRKLTEEEKEKYEAEME